MTKHGGTHTLNPSIQQAEYVELCEFKARVMGKQMDYCQEYCHG